MSNAYLIVGEKQIVKTDGALPLDAKHVVGVIFGTGQPTMNQMKSLGFKTIGLSIEKVTTNGKAPEHPTLYVFDRSPAASTVCVCNLVAGDKGELRIGGWWNERGEPHSIVPKIRGGSVDMLLKPRNNLGPADMPKKPAKTRRRMPSRRPSYRRQAFNS